MAWTKIKTIIILILLLLNIFLLALVASNGIRSASYEAAAFSQAVSVLELNSIQVEASSVPSSMPLSAATVTRDTQLEARLAAALLGEDAALRSSTGGLYYYEGSGGNASFRSGGEFSVTFSAPIPVPEDQTRAGQARELMDRMDVDVWRLTEQSSAVTAIQMLKGTPVLSNTSAGVTFFYNEGDELSSITGRLVLGRAAADPAADEPLTVPTVLIAFFNFVMDNGDACHAIHDVIPIYRAAFMSDPIRLTPAWRITTDIGDYDLDAYTAEVTRVSAVEPRNVK